MLENQIETHPFTPFLPENAKLLMLGSFPPSRERWKMEFYYPNFQNDMWRIFGLIFFENKNYFLDIDKKSFNETLICEFLVDKGIAIYDVAEKVIRLKGNASDKFLQIVTTVKLEELLMPIPECHTLMTTGDKATETLISLLPEGTENPTIAMPSHTHFMGRDLNLYRMPSSSRAYPLALEKKAELYGNFFQEIGLI
ncbi:uracil-DNA glycosylase family protein [Acinetobacter sp. 230853]|uniref:uracil-DNA glycosylase family protein n=1 Tax=Acinetobacter sp. 230853 TaxID=1310651 RepID=UPI0005502F4B|nr:uracil-DNA glycosylase family protein [Acinetobacter sp. 230853]